MENERVLFLLSSFPQTITALHVIEEYKKISPNANIFCITLDDFYHQNAHAPLDQKSIAYSRLYRPFGSKMFWDLSIVERIVLLLFSKIHVRACLEDVHPDILVLGNDIGPLERLFIAYQNSNLTGKSLLIQDGILNKEIFDPSNERFSDKIKTKIKEITTLGGMEKYGMGKCDYKALLGLETRDWLQTNGLNIDSCKITGAPRFDEYYEVTKDAVVSFVPDKRKIRVVYFSQPLVRYGYWTNQDWEEVKEILCFPIFELKDEFEFFIKLHPSDDRKYYEQSFEADDNCQNKINFLNTLTVKQSLEFADIVIVYRSTIALETLFFKKILLVLDPWKNNEAYGILNNQAGYSISNKNEYLALLRKYLSKELDIYSLDEQMQKTLEYLIFSNDGKSSNRVAKYIKEIIFTRFAE